MTREQIAARARILVVDDEPQNVRLLERILGGAGFANVASSTDGRRAPDMVAELDPDLILLDLRMPYLDGFGVLEALGPRLAAGYLPVLVLTADTTREAKQRALSGGARDFLTKPLDAAEALLRIHNLLETRFLHLEQRLLLERTLQGTIRSLTEVLALVNPAAFSRATRARATVERLLGHLDEPVVAWEVEIAALLSQLGSVTLPARTVEKLYFGRQLTLAEGAAVERLPEVAGRLVDHVPRMEGVAEILRWQGLRYDGLGSPADAPIREEIPVGARILKVVLDLDALEGRGVADEAVLAALAGRAGWYDPRILEALAVLRGNEAADAVVVEVPLMELAPGMVLAGDVATAAGVLFVARGQEVTARLVERLHNSRDLFARRQRVMVTLPRPAEP